MENEENFQVDEEQPGQKSKMSVVEYRRRLWHEFSLHKDLEDRKEEMYKQLEDEEKVTKMRLVKAYNSEVI